MILALLVLISSATAIACVEIFLATKYPISIVHLNLHNEFTLTSDDTIYEPIPNNTFNADGLRNEKNYAIQKPKNVYRIALIGDSLAFGLGLKENQRLATQLEDSLNASVSGNVQFEVLNFGVPGYGISQTVAHFKKLGIKYHPDLVLYWHWLDDAYVSDPGWASSRDNALLRLLPYFLHDESKKYGIVNNIRNRLYESQIIRHTIRYFRNRAEKLLVTKDFSTYMESATSEILSRYDKFIQSYKNKEFTDLDCCDKYYQEYANVNNFVYWNYHMKEFSTMCDEELFECLLLLTPVVYPHKSGEYNWSALHSLVEDIAHMHNIDVIDTVKSLENYDRDSIKLYPDDTEHLNGDGNRYISDLLREYIVTSKKYK